MKVIICDNSYQDQWHDFVIENSTDSGFLQSWEWGFFQEELKTQKSKAQNKGKFVFRLMVVGDDKEILALSQVIKMSLPFGKSYFYIPRGPIIASNSPTAQKQLAVLEFLFNEIKHLAKKEGAIFLRCDPAWRENENLQKIMTSAGFIFSGQVQPRSTLILDLSLSPDDLLQQMKQKTRYNIKVAQKNNITLDQGGKYLPDFWSLMKKTSKRNDIVSYANDYYQKLWQVLEPAQMAKIVVAKDGERVIAANFMVALGEWQVYLYGTSDYDYRSKMAPYLLQWQSILEAQSLGLKHYDFWGVDEDRWPGVTRFKTGFAPNKEFTTYIGSWDEVYQPLWYNMYKLMKKFKNLHF